MTNSAGHDLPDDHTTPWNFYTEAAIIIMLTFASLFFATQFFTQREHVMFSTALMALLSILGSHNRLRVALRNPAIDNTSSRRILHNHLIFCCSMGCFMGGILVILFDR